MVEQGARGTGGRQELTGGNRVREVMEQGEQGARGAWEWGIHEKHIFLIGLVC